MPVKASITGKPGSITIEVKKGFTAKDVVALAAEQFGLNDYDVNAIVVLVDGKPADPDTNVEDAETVAAAPKPTLG